MGASHLPRLRFCSNFEMVNRRFELRRWEKLPIDELGDTIVICVPVLIEVEVGTGYTAGTGTDYTYILETRSSFL